MTKREELIAEAERVMSLKLFGSISGHRLTDIATASLDAILEGLSEPSEEMLQAGILAMHKAAAYDDAAHSMIRAMLQPLKANGPSDPGIPVYRLKDGTDEVTP